MTSSGFGIFPLTQQKYGHWGGRRRSTLKKAFAGHWQAMNKDILDLVRKYWPISSVYGINLEFEPGKTMIPYSGPVWDEEEIYEAIHTLLEGKWLTSGEKVREFEREFSHHVGQQHSVMCNSGSSANLLML